MKDLSEIRAEINRVDRELVALFCRRMDCAKAVGEYKKENGVPVLNLDREKEILDRVEEEGGEYGIYTRLMYQNIMELSRALQHKIIGTGKELREKLANATHTLERQDVLVGYQGIEGANSHEASQILFPHAQLRHYKRFDDVFAAVDSGEVRYGVLPVENSTAGSVSAVYDLILKHRFYIVGALDMAIDHCLASLRQSEPEDIEIVRSHQGKAAQRRGDLLAKGGGNLRLEAARLAYSGRPVQHHALHRDFKGALPDREREQDQPLSDAAPRRGRALQPVVPLPLAGTQPHQNREPSHSGQGF